MLYFFYIFTKPLDYVFTTCMFVMMPIMKLILHLPAKHFKEIVEIKYDHHKILDNFCQMKNYLEECPRHHNVCLFLRLTVTELF